MCAVLAAALSAAASAWRRCYGRFLLHARQLCLSLCIRACPWPVLLLKASDTWRCGRLQIVVKTLKGEAMEVQVEDDASVLDLKRKLAHMKVQRAPADLVPFVGNA